MSSPADDAPAARAILDRLAALTRSEAVQQLDDLAADRVVHALAAERRSEQRHAAEVLAGLLVASPPLHRAVRHALTASDPRLRWGAAYTLGRALPPGPELWPAALETLALDDGDQRWAAAELACTIARHHPEVRAALRAELDAPSATRRKMCLYCLRDLGDPDAPALAIRLLDDPDAGVRLAALATLARVPPDAAPVRAAVVAITARLSADDDPGVRRAAAATLGKLGHGDEPILAALQAAAAAADPSLARAARGALAALGAS